MITEQHFFFITGGVLCLFDVLERRQDGVDKAAILNGALDMLDSRNEEEEERRGLLSLRHYLDEGKSLLLPDLSFEPTTEKKMLNHLREFMLLKTVFLLLGEAANRHEMPSLRETRRILEKIKNRIDEEGAPWDDIRLQITQQAVSSLEIGLDQKKKLFIILSLTFIVWFAASVALYPSMVQWSMDIDFIFAVAMSCLSVAIINYTITACFKPSIELNFFSKPDFKEEVKSIFQYADGEVQNLRKAVEEYDSELRSIKHSSELRSIKHYAAQYHAEASPVLSRNRR